MIRLMDTRHKPVLFLTILAPGNPFWNATSFSETNSLIRRITRKSSPRLAQQEGNGNLLVILSHDYFIEQMLIGESSIQKKSRESRLDQKRQPKDIPVVNKRTENLWDKGEGLLWNFAKISRSVAFCEGFRRNFKEIFKKIIIKYNNKNFIMDCKNLFVKPLRGFVQRIAARRLLI